MTNNALRLPDWEIIAVEERGDVVEVTARYLPFPDACPKCGVVGRLYRHGTAPVEYHDLPYGKRTLIHAEVQRIRCRECLVTSMQPLPHMDERRRMTKRCIAHIEQQTIHRTFADVGRTFALDEKTIRAIGTPFLLAKVAEHRWETPRLLGIDELKLDRQMRAIFMDLAAARPLDIIHSRSKRDVALWLSRLERSKVQIVTIDMTGGYNDVIRAILPNARVVIDKFHILRYADEALKHVRSKARSKAAGGTGKNPRRNVTLLRKRAHRLNPAQLFEVDGILANNPLVKDGYEAKERFHDIWKATSRVEAEKLFDEWTASLPESVSRWFGKIARMVQRWRPEVFAYFEYPATNAITENRNGLIKMVNRQGRGYTFDVIRAKALLAPSLGRMSECFLCHGEFPANSMRSLSDIKVRGNGRQAREDREMFARLTSECCTNCHHMFANFHSPEARMRWEIGASSPEEFAAMSDEQIRAVMRRNIERSSYNPYEDY
jgi:transposase